MSWWKRLVEQAKNTLGLSGGCHHGDAIHLRQGTADFEWFVARGELESKRDLAHGACHLANLLAFDPGHPEWLALADAYLQATPDPEKLIPRQKEAYFGTEALRAYIWQKQGKLAEAVDLLCQVTQAKPDARYLEAWVLDWLETPGELESLPEEVALRLFVAILSRAPEAKCATVARLAETERWSHLSEAYAALHGSEELQIMLRAGILRKAGRLHDAERVAREATERSPSWHSATALGLALRAMPDRETEAAAAFRQAAELDPSDHTAFMEAADMYFDRGRWEEALPWYQAACQRESGQPWATATQLYCQWKLTNEQALMEEVVNLAEAGNDRAQFLCQREFYSELPEPMDATANLLRHLHDEILKDPAQAPSGVIDLSLSCLESPSSLLAIRLQMEAMQHDIQLEVAIERIPRPDPRWPCDEVKYRLWDFEGTTAQPGLPLPGEDISGWVAELASARFDEAENWAQASRIASKIPPERASELLATMVHPPTMPRTARALVWLPRVQLAAAQIIVHLETDWIGSTRREALYSVLLGPQDWATLAAIRVLSQLGIEYEPYAPDIDQAFQKLAAQLPDTGHCHWEYELYQRWQHLPHLFPHERQKMEKIVRQIEKNYEEQRD